MPNKKDEDIRDVMREERGRGRKPIDVQAQRENKEREAALLRIMEKRDREALKQALALYFTPKEVEEKLRLYDATLGRG